ncbi:hypothetical protein B0I35DRAFT_479932 [Stachybotrys elegans]|uniref:DUF6923 domain-containing protein n=1 Tax=Stachybotrys elegans TaxID=80388 RepID=A0A8K0SN87_9HYPO|nr:hypothetical protein B0I35DRAFT_479932 [Stachybotrys elegans]
MSSTEDATSSTEAETTRTRSCIDYFCIDFTSFSNFYSHRDINGVYISGLLYFLCFVNFFHLYFICYNGLKFINFYSHNDTNSFDVFELLCFFYFVIFYLSYVIYIIYTRSTTTTSTSTTSATGPSATFNCPPQGFLIQQRTFYRVDIATGATTLIHSDVGPGGNINAIGYNRFDNFIYGILIGSSNSQVIRISASGDYTLLNLRLSSTSINSGDIDNQGHYWVTESGRDWWQIDLSNSATFGTVLRSGTATLRPSANFIADWSYVPGGGDYLYGVVSNGDTSTLSRFSRTSFTWSSVRELGNVVGSNTWGALYSAADGTMYGGENTSGTIYKFPVAPTPGNATFLSNIPPTSLNDGARCIDSANIS